MTLSDMMAYRQVIGCLMQKPLLLLEYTDIHPSDFDYKPARVCFNSIRKLYEAGAIALSPLEVDQEIERCGGAARQAYTAEGGLEFLKSSYEFAQLGNFKIYYTRVKKNALLRKLQKAKYDISDFFIDDKDVTNPAAEAAVIQRLEDSSLEDILNTVEQKYSEIRNEFLHGGNLNGDPATGLLELVDELQKVPSIGPSLEGKIFSSACRGARPGCFFLKSASTSGGKTRTSVYDACRLAYPKRWSHKAKSFIEEITTTGEVRAPRKVLFIVTEMDVEELQTIMLAYMSGVDEDHILTGKYEFGELSRVKQAAQIIKEYSGYFLIEEISDPNLQNVEATIRKYVTVDNIQYCFFDYIHSTASMIGQFAHNNLREDVILMMLANQLKQLAKDYNIFIFSATQVNAMGMGDDELAFRDEKSIRGSKAVADKCDMGVVISTISDKAWQSLIPALKVAVREGVVNADILTNKPTHVFDIYKMRRGRYKNVRIWSRIHLGTGEREDLFITNAANQPINEPVDLFMSASERPITITVEKEVKPDA